MQHLNMQTPDGAQLNLDALYQICPSCFTEGKDAEGKLSRKVNWNKLRELLGEHAEENAPESYDFTWVGKRAAQREAAAPINKTLRPCPEESVDWENTQNLYIEGDNLEVLKLLQNSYMGKVKMIYIDPPYNTGNDFVYHDDFAQSADEYDEHNINEAGERFRKNTDSNGRFHSDWCSMMYARLMVARSLLKEDGLVFMSIDDNEVENLKHISDEVFGECNFIGQITLLCNPKGRSQDKYIANCHEYLLVYSKTVLPNGSVSIPKSKEEIEKDYTLKDNNGVPYREMELRNTHRDFGKFNRPNLWYPIYAFKDGTVSLKKSGAAIEVYPVWDDGFEGCWTWGKDKAEKEVNDLLCKNVAGKTKIYRKSYAYSDVVVALKQVKSIWNDNAFFTEKGQTIFNLLFGNKAKIFQSPKSVNMIKQCLQMAQDKESIVLDFFSGSGTTAHSVMQLNLEDGGSRTFIVVQLPAETMQDSEAYKAGYKTICEIGKERIRRAGAKIKAENPNVDTGFRVFKCDSSNMKDVYFSPSEYTQDLIAQMEDNIKEDRTDLDLLFDCMLRWGVELSLPLCKQKVGDCTIHNVNDGDLVACFDGKITEEVIDAIAALSPLRVVFRDSSFTEASEKMNLFELFKQKCSWSEQEVMNNVRVI